MERVGVGNPYPSLFLRRDGRGDSGTGEGCAFACPVDCTGSGGWPACAVPLGLAVGSRDCNSAGHGHTARRSRTWHRTPGARNAVPDLQWLLPRPSTALVTDEVTRRRDSLTASWTHLRKRWQPVPGLALKLDRLYGNGPSCPLSRLPDLMDDEAAFGRRGCMKVGLRPSAIR